jgi:hypothetical protein
VIRAISRSFVPVGQNLYAIRKAKGPAGDFYRAVDKQRPQYQGLYVVAPDGKLLASRASQPKKGSWTADTLKMVHEALEAYGSVTPREVKAVDPLPFRGAGVRDDGSILLKVSLRHMFLGLDPRGLSEPAHDSIPLTASMRTSLALAEAKRGATWAVPAQIARRLHRVLSPSTDANHLARLDEVSRARLSGTVERVRDGVAYLSFEGDIAGEHTWEFDPHKGKKIRASMKLTGVGTADAKSGELQSITLVGDGRYRPISGDESKYGAVVEWRLRRE